MKNTDEANFAPYKSYIICLVGCMYIPFLFTNYSVLVALNIKSETKSKCFLLPCFTIANLFCGLPVVYTYPDQLCYVFSPIEYLLLIILGGEIYFTLQITFLCL